MSISRTKHEHENTRGELLLMCTVIVFFLQYSVPCLFLKYMKPDKRVWQHRHNTEDCYFDLCSVTMSETMRYICLNPWVKIDLSVCSTAKHWCSVAPLICLPEHTVYILQKKTRVQIIKNKQTKGIKKKKKGIIKVFIVTLPIPEKAFGHNQLPIPNRNLGKEEVTILNKIYLDVVWIMTGQSSPSCLCMYLFWWHFKKRVSAWVI